jgi:hypothetical protein
MLREEMEEHNRSEMAKHLDLCRVTIEKIPHLEEEIRSLKAMLGVGSSQMQAQSSHIRGIVRHAVQVVNIEVDHHDDIIRHSWPWKSPVFEIDSMRLLFELVPVCVLQTNGDRCTIYLTLAKDNKVIIPFTGVALTGECELFAKETGQQIHKIEPFRVVLTTDFIRRGFTIDTKHEIGTFLKSDIMQDGRTLAPCVVYKLSIWNILE